METEDNTNLRVASFSYYLDTAKDNLVQRISAHENPIVISSGRTPSITKPVFNTRENFVFKMPGPVKDPTAAFSFPQESPCPMNFERTKTDDGEIRVFGADKYFNIKPDYSTESKTSDEYKKEPQTNLPQVQSNSRSEIQSLYSETSSWNSQTALLQKVSRRLDSQTKRKRAIGRRFFPRFGCHGPCLDNKAVHISDNLTGSKKADHFAFSIPNPGIENLSVKNQAQAEAIKGVEQPRESLEIFGSARTGTKGDIAKNLERKLSMLTWDAIPKYQNLPTSTIGSSTICDDMASDASSDLFEIENISGSTVYPLLTVDQETETMSTCMSPPTQYAPSEVSIEWSIVTASAADYSSVVSDYDEKSVSVAGDLISRNALKTKNTRGKETQKSKPGGLLGCKNHKAVDVAKTTYKTNEKAKHLGLNLSLSTGKSQARIRAKDF